MMGVVLQLKKPASLREFCRYCSTVTLQNSPSIAGFISKKQHRSAV